MWGADRGGDSQIRSDSGCLPAGHPVGSSPREGRACSGETQKYVNIVSTVCTGVCCQLYLANLQTGIRAEQLDISLFLKFLFFFFSCKPFCLLCKLGICYHDSLERCLELVIAFFCPVLLFRGDLNLIISG